MNSDVCRRCEMCARCTYPNLTRVNTCLNRARCVQPKTKKKWTSVHDVLASLVVSAVESIGLMLPKVLAKLIVEFADPVAASLIVKEKCYAVDYVRYTYCATIENIVCTGSHIYILVKYRAGWLSRWDEWIPYSSLRIRRHEPHESACTTVTKRNYGSKDPETVFSFCAHQKFCALLKFKKPLFGDPYPSSASACQTM